VVVLQIIQLINKVNGEAQQIIIIIIIMNRSRKIVGVIIIVQMLMSHLNNRKMNRQVVHGVLVLRLMVVGLIKKLNNKAILIIILGE